MPSLSNFRNSLLTMANSFFFRRLVISKQNVYTEKWIQDISPTLILLKNDCFIPPTWLMQSVPVTINIVSLNHVQGAGYPIQHYVIKFVSDKRRIGGFLRALWFPPLINLYRHYTIEILLKVALNNITYNPPTWLAPTVKSIFLSLSRFCLSCLGP